jgi:CRP/FNR family transcriptional regulator, nitrogen oxide reductase regulator
MHLHEGTESRFLKGLTRSELALILSKAETRRVSPNKIVVQQDDPAQQFFLITKGQARYFFVTEEGRKILLFSLLPGDVFGGAALLAEPAHYLLGAEAVKESRLLVWRRCDIRALAEKYPRLSQNMMIIAYDYLGWYLAAHVGLACHTAAQRLAAVLVSLAHTVGHKGPNGMEIEATNEELANTACVTLFTASRLMSKWQHSGVILKKRGRVIIESPEQLLLKRAIQHKAPI